MARITYPLLKAFYSDGRPLVGGKVHTYTPDSNIRNFTYADVRPSPGVLNSNSYSENPIILNADGEAKVFINDHLKNLKQPNRGTSGVLSMPGKIQEFDAPSTKGRTFDAGITFTKRLIASKSGMDLDSADDDFSDPLWWNYLWTAYDFGIAPNVDNGYLQFAVTSTDYDYGITDSNFKLIGDFNIQIDFDNTNNPYTYATGSVTSEANADFGIISDDKKTGTGPLTGPILSLTHSGDYSGGATVPYYTHFEVGVGAISSIETSDKSGKFKITRSGTNYPALDGSATIEFSYWRSSTARWVSMGSRSYDNSACYVTIYGDKQNQDPSFSVDNRFDNFVVNSADSMVLV